MVHCALFKDSRSMASAIDNIKNVEEGAAGRMRR